MARETPFSVVTRRMLDAWIQTSPEQPPAAEDIYGEVLGLLSIKMRLTVIRIDGDDPKNWFMKAVRHSGFTSRLINVNKLFADCRLGEFKDRRYMEEAVIPRLKEVLERQQPVTERVVTRLLGLNVGYDRVLLPQKNTGRPEWVISSSYAQFLLSPPASRERLEIADEAIIQLLVEGATAKEIAATLEISHRTVEHRMERMKQRYGAKNAVHLVAMLIATHLERSPSAEIGSARVRTAMAGTDVDV